MPKTLALAFVALFALSTSALAQQKPMTLTGDGLHRDPAAGREVREVHRQLLEQRLRLRGPVHRRRHLPAVDQRQAGHRHPGAREAGEVSGGGSSGCKNVGWIQQGVRHLYPNHVIEATPEGAKGTVDMLMIGLGGDPNKIQYDGHYEDIYVKTPQGWRFKQRTHFALLSGGRPAAPAPAAK
jgi:hypothetical protein